MTTGNGPSNGRNNHDLSKGTLPVVMVLGFALALAGAGYTMGGVMEGILQHRTETNKRLVAIETSITLLQNELTKCARK